MSATARTLKLLLTALCRMQSNSWSEQDPLWHVSEDLYQAWVNLGSRNWYPVTEPEIKDFFENLDRVTLRLSTKQALYLPPIADEPGVIPVLSFEYDCDKSKDAIKLRVMLVRPHDGSFFGFGFRMEEGLSMHGFYHAQLIGNLAGAGETKFALPIECPKWLPETQPAIPLKAKDSVTLLLCMLISLYGIRFCWTFVNVHQITELRPYLEYFGRPT